MNKLVIAAALLAAPLAARADIGLRLGGEADLAYNANDGRHAPSPTIGRSLNAMLQLLDARIGPLIDLELGEQGDERRSQRRAGVRVLRPGIRLTPPAFPISRRDPINIEQPSGYPRETFDLGWAPITIPPCCSRLHRGCVTSRSAVATVPPAPSRAGP